MPFSTIVSRVFEPVIVLPVLVAAAAAHAGLPDNRLLTFYVFFFVAILLPIVAFRLWLVKKRGIVWDIPKRRDRIVPFTALACYGVLGYAFVHLWQNIFLSHLFAVVLLWFVGLLLVTLRIKISGHVATSALAALLLVRWFGVLFAPTLLLVPLVAWARVTGKNHTFGEVIIGAIFSLTIFFVGIAVGLL